MQSCACRLVKKDHCTRARSPRSIERQAGAIRVRTMIELTVLFLGAYLVFQAAPAVIARVRFLNELTVIANSSVLEDASVLRQKVMTAAASHSIAVVWENVHVTRDPEQNKTIIDVRYELFMNFFPRSTYVWHVEDHVEALLF